ncbi:MAG: hypothetical protein Q7R35_07855 [Elusimicrobiota bacterium]|nr:hypothetical protein [Elusimicrobiota bacterium]
MGNNIKNPGALLALGLTVFFASAFLLTVHIGVSGREVQGMSYGFGSRSAPAAAPAPPTTYLGDFKKGAGIIQKKSEAIYDSFFGGGAQAAPGSGGEEAGGEVAGQRAPGGEDYSGGDSDGDAFEKYYKKNYAGNSGKGGGSAGAAWADMGGGGSASSGGGGSFSETASQGASPKEPQKKAGTETASSGAPGPVPPPGAGFGGPAGDGKSAAAPRLYASLPGKNSPENAGLNPGGQPGASPVYGSGQPRKGGGLSNMPGQKSGVPLDGASEAMKAGSQSNYDSKMSGGAAASAASGGSAPAASAAKEDAAGGASAKAGDAAAKPGDAAAKPGDKDAKTDPVSRERGPSYYRGESAADDQDLLKSVVTDRLNGTEAKYVSDEEAQVAVEEGLLKSGAVAESEDDADAAGKEAPNRDRANKDAHVKAPVVPDPVNLSDLSSERRVKLKKRIHTFLKRVENKYGKMTEIYRTPCGWTPDLCKDHEVNGSYLTMTTAKSAKLVLGVKYVKTRWRRYTMDFKKPPVVVKPPVYEDEPEEAPAEATE